MEAEKRIKDINEAYDILSNSDNRRNYDRENEPHEEFKQNNFQYNPFNCRTPKPQNPKTPKPQKPQNPKYSLYNIDSSNIFTLIIIYIQ